MADSESFDDFFGFDKQGFKTKYQNPGSLTIDFVANTLCSIQI